MADIIRNTRIQLRKDTLANWQVANPILKLGELAIVVDSNGNEMVKVGDGTTEFNSLDFLWSEEFTTKSLSATSATVTSLTQGLKTSATTTSIATGIMTEVSANFAQVHGIEASVLSNDDYAFVWNGTNLPGIAERYTSHGEGTFSINPVNGLSGVYVGESNLADSFSKVTFRNWTSSDINI